MKKLILAAFIALSVAACNVHLIPSPNPIALYATGHVDTTVSNLYEEIIASTDKRYVTYQPKYGEIDDQLSTILSIDSSRQQSKYILVLANDIKARFDRYEADHKNAGVLNNTQLSIKKKEMHTLILALYDAEKNLK